MDFRVTSFPEKLWVDMFTNLRLGHEPFVIDTTKLWDFQWFKSFKGYPMGVQGNIKEMIWMCLNIGDVSLAYVNFMENI